MANAMSYNNPLISPANRGANPRLERRYSITVTNVKRQRPVGSGPGRRPVVPVLFRVGFFLEVILTLGTLILAVISWLYWTYDTITLLTILGVLQFFLTLAALIHMVVYRNGCVYCLFATLLWNFAFTQMGVGATDYAFANNHLNCSDYYAELSLVKSTCDALKRMPMTERQICSTMWTICGIVNLLVLLLTAAYWCFPDAQSNEIEEIETKCWDPIEDNLATPNPDRNLPVGITNPNRRNGSANYQR